MDFAVGGIFLDKEKLIQDMARMRYLVGQSYSVSENLVNQSFRERPSPKSLREDMETAVGQFERATVELRRICESYEAPVNAGGKAPPIPAREITGSVETLDRNRLHIRVNTLLPSCRYRAAEWLSDTIRRLLDSYEQSGQSLPYYSRALMVIEERSDIYGRRVFDQDNKGWKAVSNAIKGRLIPDDDQYTLGIALLSLRSSENACHITLMDADDAGDFFTVRGRGGCY